MSQLITILGPTASGKTALAVALARRVGAEVLSADSRQVYRGMDIGTGKDLSEYTSDGVVVPYHLIDICPAGSKYNLFEYQRDFYMAYNNIISRGVTPIMCGGTGLYLESILKGYNLMPVPENPGLRQELQGKSLKELTSILSSYKVLHNTTDVDTSKRAIRAIEIEEYYRTHPKETAPHPPIESLVFGIEIDRELRRERITSRLKERLDNGLIEEVGRLLDNGISAQDLIYYGLEYKYVTLYIIGELSYKYLVSELEVAIHQFAKRQMTWFRGMERRGIKIEWIPFEWPVQQKIAHMVELMDSKS